MQLFQTYFKTIEFFSILTYNYYCDLNCFYSLALFMLLILTVCVHNTFYCKLLMMFAVGCSSSVVEQTLSLEDLLLFGILGNFIHPTLPVSFGRDIKSCWSRLPGVYARGSKNPTHSV